MKNSFQTIVIVVFCIAFVFAVAVFSGLFSSNSTSNSNEPAGPVTIWGVIPTSQVQPYFSNLNSRGLGYSAQYSELPAEDFVNTLINSLADGTSPDIVIINSEIFTQFREKIYPIPYASFTERMFRDSFVDGSQIFLSGEGVLAVPLLVDPLVVYYNKDLLAASNYVLPPRSWNKLAIAVPLFLRRDAKGNISQTAVAMGEGSNVNHARDILSALFLQTGNPIVSYNPSNNSLQAVLNQNQQQGQTELLTATALSFFINFSNPTNSNYSWNRSLPNSLDVFVAGRSAFYIGRASELFSIQAENPNLNFDVMELFQPEGATRNITFGSFVGASMLKSAPNPTAAFAVISDLSSDQAIDAISKSASLPPSKRSLLALPQTNPYVSVFFRSALSSFAWPDPNPSETEQIFRDMISNVASGRTDAGSSINEANSDLQTNTR